VKIKSKINLKSWLVIFLLFNINSISFADEINFECFVTVSHNILPRAYQSNKEFPRTFKYNPDPKVLKNTINNLEYSCGESDFDLVCNTRSGNSIHKIVINRVSLRVSNEIIDGDLFINERGVCSILKASDKKF
jgi:hypothetical protein